MTGRLTVTKQVHFRRGRGTRKLLKEGKAPEPEVLGRIPRISRVMALAVWMRKLVDEGEVVDYADLARLAHVSRARITQFMSLLHLAPDIQEEILFLPRTRGGRASIREHMVRAIAAVIDWRKQCRMWSELKSEVQA